METGGESHSKTVPFGTVTLQSKNPATGWEADVKGTEAHMRISDCSDKKDADAFAFGIHDHLSEWLGAHVIRDGVMCAVCFRVWAPAAVMVYVAGSFNSWNPKSSPMERKKYGGETEGESEYDCGIWECRIENAAVGDEYLFVVETSDGRWLYKTDPYARQYTLRPDHNCIIKDLPKADDASTWSDYAWMRKREQVSDYNHPMNILEVHPGSMWRHEDGSWYNYRELGEALCAYVKKMSYTHVEFLGLMEHPSDRSWGYQVTGYFAPTSRYGTAEDFIAMVNRLHCNGIGVILDWVPAHFARDEYSLTYYDGTPLYEYGHPFMGENRGWGTKVFDYGKREVVSFLISSALFWLKQYHIDGIRVDAVAAMLYLNYDRPEGQWIPNRYGGNTNLEAIALLKLLNSRIHEQFPGVVTIAEESSAWPHCTGEAEDGLGFDYKWNMGWMHDVLDYMQTDPLYRKYCHNKMTFSLTYENAEQFVLPLSHDEVVHLKKPMLYKMSANDNRLQFASLKTIYTFMYGHPGKKLLFMGDDFGVRSEWNENTGLDWGLLEQPEHRQLQEFMQGLMRLYANSPALWSMDDHRNYDCFDGFEWLTCDDCDRGIFSFVRRCREQTLVFMLHFTPVDRYDYIAKAPGPGRYRLLLDEAGYYGPDEERFVLTAKLHQTEKSEEKTDCVTQPEYELATSMTAYGIRVYEWLDAGKTYEKNQ